MKTMQEFYTGNVNRYLNTEINIKTRFFKY